MAELAQVEEILEAGSRGYYEVGRALLAIRNGQLYRAKYRGFGAYCEQRWKMDRTYAWRTINAAARVKLLLDDDNVPPPEHESQIRPFLRLRPDAFPRAWKEVLARAREKKITARLIESVIREIFKGSIQAFGVEKPRTDHLVSLWLSNRGQVLALLHQARRSIENNYLEHALDSLARIERLLFG